MPCSADGRGRLGGFSSEAIKRETEQTRDALRLFRAHGRTCFFEGGAVKPHKIGTIFVCVELLVEGCFFVHKHP